MIRVATPSRLHFGMLSLAPEAQPPSEVGEVLWPRRRFGGVGLMIEAPGVCVAVEPADTWSAEGPLADRALDFARRFGATQPPEARRPHRILVERSSPEHMGLGTGTQLGLALARALAISANSDDTDAIALAARIGRGQRSGLGIHGFAQGGFLLEAGRRERITIAPLVARADFPETWRLVLVLPPWGTGLHGRAELEAFAHLRAPPATETDALCRLVLLGMLPGLIERDLATFGEALLEFNARVGELFASVQGGTYSSPRTEEVIRFVRRQGVKGVGQSSWGPAVFAVVADADQGEDLARRLRQRFLLGPDEVLCVCAANHGATVEVS
jgi:beta-RFAP synthase